MTRISASTVVRTARAASGGLAAVVVALLVLALAPEAATQVATRVSPPGGTVGDQVTVTGRGFGGHKGRMWLAHPDSNRKQRFVIHKGGWSDTSVTGSLRRIRGVFDPGTYDLVVEPRGQDPIVVPKAFRIRGPSVQALKPGVFTPGGIVTVAGKDFGTTKGRVRVAGRWARVLVWEPDAVAFRVPSFVRAGVAEVLVKNPVGEHARNGTVVLPRPTSPPEPTLAKSDEVPEPEPPAAPDIANEPTAAPLPEPPHAVGAPRLAETRPAGDIDHDGIAELLVLLWRLAPDASEPPELMLVTGHDATPHWKIPLFPTGMTPGDVDVTGFGDADGDGRGDVVLAINAGGTTAIRVLSGLDGHVITTVSDPPRSASVLPGGDMDGDGLADVLTYGVAEGRRVFAFFSGATGAPIHSALAMPDRALADGYVGPDWNGDGVADVLVDPYRYVDSATGELVDHGRLADWDREVVRVVIENAPGDHEWLADLDGDQRPDLVANRDGFVVAFSGKDGGLLWKRPGTFVPRRGGLIGNDGVAGPVRYADIDGDGAPDPLIRAVDPASDTLVTRVISGRSGADLDDVRAITESGHGLVSAGDLDGDGKEELVPRVVVGRGGSDDFTGVIGY